MKRFITSMPLIGLLFLASCGTTPPANIVQQIQQTAIAVCGFLPTVATVANILAAGNPLVSSVTSVANAICQAVTAVPRTAKRRGLPMVNGVVIHGRFVK